MKMKKIIALVLAILSIMTLAAVPVVAATSRQQACASAASVMRDAGFINSDAGVAVLSDTWLAEGGNQSVSGSYYYSARTGQCYYLTVNGSNGANNSIWDGARWWYWNANGYWYSADGQISYTRPGQQGGGGQGNLYSGVLPYNTTYKQSDEASATMLAKIIVGWAYNAGETVQSCVGWTVLNSVAASGVNATVSTVANIYGYNANGGTIDAVGRDVVALARDLLYRWRLEQATNNGITQSNSGRTLPASYLWIYKSNNGELSFQNDANGANGNWNFSLQTPYST